MVPLGAFHGCGEDSGNQITEKIACFLLELNFFKLARFIKTSFSGVGVSVFLLCVGVTVFCLENP